MADNLTASQALGGFMAASRWDRVEARLRLDEAPDLRRLMSLMGG